MDGDDKEFAAIPLTLNVVWKNSPPIFCMVTKTVVDLTNEDLCYNTPALPHRIYEIAEAIFLEAPPTLHPALPGLTRYPYLRRPKANTAAYVDVFIDNFLGLSQVPTHRHH